MNRHQQEAKKYLSQTFGLNQRIESKLGQIERAPLSRGGTAEVFCYWRRGRGRLKRGVKI